MNNPFECPIGHHVCTDCPDGCICICLKCRSRIPKRTVLVVEVRGLRDGEEKNILEMLESAVYNSKRDPNPPAGINWRFSIKGEEDRPWDID